MDEKIISIYRYSNKGFDFTNQTHINNNLFGCHIFVEHIDEYMLNGISSFRKKEALHHKKISENTIVLGRNVCYILKDNGYGYMRLFPTPFYENIDILDWVEMPLLVVAENALLIKSNDPIGYFGCEAILIS